MTKKKKLPDIVLEISGGALQGVYARTKLCIDVVDWDNIKVGGDIARVENRPTPMGIPLVLKSVRKYIKERDAQIKD